MAAKYLVLQVAIFALAFSSVQCWDQNELDMYDLIEELGMKPNFYEHLGISENATSAEVRRSFRQLSLIHHPDKSDAEDADIKFRRLVAVYEVLRDSSRREMYDKFLVEGLPDWRSVLYYYRRARKMGMLEITIIISLFTTVGQYLTAWAGYKEKQLTVEDAVRAKFKRERKQGKDIDYDALVDQYMTQVERPSWWNTLPFQTVRAARWLVCSAPFELVESVRSERRRREEERLAAEELLREEQEQREEQQRQRDRRRENKERKRQRLKELPEAAPPLVADDAAASAVPSGGAAPTKTWSTARSGPWADGDLIELSRLVKRHPGGTPERWELIAETLERTVPEVTKMAAIIRSRPHMVPVSASAQTHTADGQQVDDSVLEPAVVPDRKVKTRAPDATGPGVEEAAWAQTQQKALEAALAQFPKGTSERWERVAKAVPGKTKEECMSRFKYLSDLLKKRKEADAKKEEEEAAAESTESEAKPGTDTSAVINSAVERCSNSADS